MLAAGCGAVCFDFDASTAANTEASFCASAGLPPLPTDFWARYPNDWTAASGNAPSWRAAPTFNIDDTLTVLKDRHSLTFGTNYLISNADSSAQQMVPTINLDFNTNFDPAISLFTTANFAGASSTKRVTAWSRDHTCHPRFWASSGSNQVATAQGP